MEYKRPEVQTYAKALKERFAGALAGSGTVIAAPVVTEDVASDESDSAGGVEPARPVDALETYLSKAFANMKTNASLMDRINTGALPWMEVQAKLTDALSSVLDHGEREDIAHNNVRRFLNEVWGDGKWKTERRPRKQGTGTVTYIVKTGG